MAQKDYLPSSDAGVEAFCDNFGRLVQLAPTTYQLTDAMADDYVLLVDDFRAKLQASLQPDTRGRRTVFLKDEAKRSLVALTRRYARQINNLLNVTDAQRQALGLTIASEHRTPTPVPTVAPILKLVKVDERTVTLELLQAGNRRRKPAKVHGATIVTAAGEVLPATTNDWTFNQNTTRTSVTVAFAPSAVGGTVHITAFWTNNRGESGPAARPLMVKLPAGGVTADLPQAMKLAA